MVAKLSNMSIEITSTPVMEELSAKESLASSNGMKNKKCQKEISESSRLQNIKAPAVENM